MIPYFPIKTRQHLLIVVVVFVSVTCFISHTKAKCIESEKNALLQFKQGIQVDNCGILSSWSNHSDSLDCCQWHGIDCDNRTDHVTMLSLPGIGFHLSCLQGKLSDSLGELRHLKHLDLSCNNFQNQPIPSFIGSIANLEYLNLSFAGFTGVIPHQFGNLSRLLSLDVSGIDLSRVANWVSMFINLPSLQEIYMDVCGLSSISPSTIQYTNFSQTLHVISLSENFLSDASQLKWLLNLKGLNTSLVHIDLSYNLMKGRIPCEIYDKHNLSYINLSGNYLEGYIPNTISNLKRLTYLDLSLNEFLIREDALKSLGSLCNLQTLNLRFNNVTCELSDMINSLSNCAHNSLVSLDLRDNRFWGSIPHTINKFSRLTELYVEGVELNGTISQEIGQLSRLELLSITHTSFKGAVTHTMFSNLSKLRLLYLGNNPNLEFNLSVDWIPPFQLDELDLHSSEVGPYFPKWLHTQKNLAVLDLTSASIVDNVPRSFWTSLSSSNLHRLDMSNNSMSGEVPSLSYTFKTAPRINLGSNAFTGAIPSFLKTASFLDLSNNKFSSGLAPFFRTNNTTEVPLYYLDFSNNLLSDKLPDHWMNFNQLSVLHLENNNLTGNLPSSIVELDGLRALHLRNNNFSGELPESLMNFSSLVILDLAYNSFSGYLSPTFGNDLKNMGFLLLKGNHFSGVLPSSLCNLSLLQILDLSNNHFAGKIPECLKKLKGMTKTSNLILPDFVFLGLYLGYGRVESEKLMWKRTEQSFGNGTLGLVKAIDLSNNKLQGQIPQGISNLIGLKYLNLSRNNLSQTITPSIGQMTSLETLDLSHNHLTGEVPQSLSQISSLAVLDLSENNLTGKIPIGTQLQGFDASCYAGNPGLCGAPLDECPYNQTQHEYSVTRHHRINHFYLGLYISVVLGFMTGFWLVCGTLVIKTSWRIAFFKLFDDIKDKIYVMVAVNMAKAWRRF